MKPKSKTVLNALCGGYGLIWIVGLASGFSDGRPAGIGDIGDMLPFLLVFHLALPRSWYRAQPFDLVYLLYALLVLLHVDMFLSAMKSGSWSTLVGNGLLGIMVLLIAWFTVRAVRELKAEAYGGGPIKRNQ
jgi:hypothetical protein